MACFEGKPMDMMTPQPQWLQDFSKQFGQQLSGGMQGGATQMPGGLFNQWQQAAQTPGFMGGVSDIFSQGYQAPQAWGQAQDIYGQMGQYQPQAPQAWGQAQQGLSEMARTGMPTSADPWYRQMQKTLGSQLKRSGADLAEKFGLGGMRYSSGLGAQLGQLATEGQERLGSDFLGREMQAREAARGRQMGAYGGLGQLGQMQAGLGMFGQQMRGQAASGLAGLGGMQARGPLDWAQGATGAGQGMQQMNLQAMQPQLQEFFRMASENNPWLQQMQQYLPGAGGMMQQQPQMYQPSPFSQFMGAAQGGAGIGNLLGWNPFGGGQQGQQGQQGQGQINPYWNTQGWGYN